MPTNSALRTKPFRCTHGAVSLLSCEPLSKPTSALCNYQESRENGRMMTLEENQPIKLLSHQKIGIYFKYLLSWYFIKLFFVTFHKILNCLKLQSPTVIGQYGTKYHLLLLPNIIYLTISDNSFNSLKFFQLISC